MRERGVNVIERPLGLGRYDLVAARPQRDAVLFICAGVLDGYGARQNGWYSTLYHATELAAKGGRFAVGGKCTERRYGCGGDDVPNDEGGDSGGAIGDDLQRGDSAGICECGKTWSGYWQCCRWRAVEGTGRVDSGVGDFARGGVANCWADEREVSSLGRNREPAAS